jgi:hypothetical protein
VVPRCRLGGRDLLADTLDVKAGQAVNGAIATLTQHCGSLAGTLLDESGGPGAAVLVYPIDERYRGLSAQRIRYVVSSPFGDYTAMGLRPGAYRVVHRLRHGTPARLVERHFRERPGAAAGLVRG